MLFPPPPRTNKAKTSTFLVGGFLICVILAAILSFISQRIYILALYEMSFGLLLGFLWSLLAVRFRQFDFRKLKIWLAIGLVFLYALSLYFNYQIILSSFGYDDFSFLYYIGLKLETGYTVQNLNTGWYGVVLHWIFQPAFSFYCANAVLESEVFKYMVKQVPEPLLKVMAEDLYTGKTKKQLREILIRMGWDTDIDQQLVFTALEDVYEEAERTKRKDAF